jgi:hypothetical protein
LRHRHRPATESRMGGCDAVCCACDVYAVEALAANVIAIYSRSRRKRRTPDSTPTVVPRVERLYSPDELTELRRNVLRYARTFPPGEERNQHLQVAVSLRALFKNQQWRRDHVRNDS